VQSTREKFFGSFFQKRTSSLPFLMKHAHIIGAGVAGLAAALSFADKGWRVFIYEAAPAAGGRCRSYFDRELGCRIDNGNHLLLSGNDATMTYLRQTGGTLTGPQTPLFPFVDVSTGRRWTLRPNLGRLPWWIFSAARRVPDTKPRDYLGLLALRRAKADATVDATLAHGPLWHNLLESLAISALNTPTEIASARLLGAVVDQSLARGGAACIPRYPAVGLSESFVDPALARLKLQRADLQTGRRIAGLTIGGDRVTGLLGPDGPVTLEDGDAVVSAVPAPVAADLLPGLTVPDEFQPIVNVHFLTDCPTAGDAGFYGIIGGTAEWVFEKPGIAAVTISAAGRLLDWPADRIAAAVWPDVRAALGLADPMPRYRVVKEKRATFAATPHQDRRRPRQVTSLQNFVLAGDWTATGLPATIEGAIRSGRAAAAALTDHGAAALSDAGQTK
jgi:squalene-associated FAD-dependent desaturase